MGLSVGVGVGLSELCLRVCVSPLTNGAATVLHEVL